MLKTRHTRIKVTNSRYIEELKPKKSEEKTICGFIGGIVGTTYASLLSHLCRLYGLRIETVQFPRKLTIFTERARLFTFNAKRTPRPNVSLWSSPYVNWPSRVLAGKMSLTCARRYTLDHHTRSHGSMAPSSQESSVPQIHFSLFCSCGCAYTARTDSRAVESAHCTI